MMSSRKMSVISSCGISDFSQPLRVLRPIISSWRCTVTLLTGMSSVHAPPSVRRSSSYGYFSLLLRFTLDPDVVFDAYEKIPSIKAKDEFVVNLTKTILDPTFEINTTADKQAFLLDVIGFNMIMEGIFFYAGFAMMLQLMRNNKMKGIGEQFQYILRDESIHIAY